ncbi:DoxX family protein [Brachybacterium sp. DNPG3]
MGIALWIIAGLLALGFLGAGGMKASSSKEKLAENGMGWVEGFQPWQVRAIGILEVLGAVGLIVPGFLSGLGWLVPTAATGLLILMIGAVVVHARRKEAFTPALVLGILSLVIVVGRFAIQPF